MSPFAKLIQSLLSSDPTAVAQAVESISPKDAVDVLQDLPARELSRVIERLESSKALQIVKLLPAEARAGAVAELSPRDAALLMRQLDDEVQAETLRYVHADVAQRFREALEYPADTAGGIMEPLATTLLSDLTVEQAVSVIRSAPRQYLYYLYVVDRERKLVGVLNTRDLLLADPKTRVNDIASRDLVSVPALMDREEVANVIRQRKFLALPVVGNQGRLLGVVSHEQVVDTVEEEAFEDLQRTVGAGADETALSPILTVVTRRLPWLVLNLLTTFVAAAVVGTFESVIAQVTALAVLLPVVAGQAGNSGAQSLAVVLRGLALDEISPGTVVRLLRKEMVAGAVNGFFVAMVCGGGVWIWSNSVALALVIAASMWLCLVLSPLVGAAIPLLLHRFGLDPAQSSTIFLTTFTEIAGFGLFLGFAKLCLRWLM